MAVTPRRPQPEPRRGLVGLLRATATLYRSQLPVVLSVSAAIVVSVDLIMGLGLHQIAGRYQARASQGAGLVGLAVSVLVLTPLITGAMAHLLVEVYAERRPRAPQVLQRALDLFAPMLVVVALYAAAVAAGLSLLVLPGVYLFVLWYFASLCAAIEGRRAFGALQRSAELVSGRWLRTLGSVFVLNVAGAVPPLALGIAVDAAARAVDLRAVSLVGTMAVQILSLSFVALGGGLLFFDLRAGRPVRAG